MEITLKELLDSREERVWHQRELIDKHGGVLLCVTLNIPGPVKDRPQYRELMKWAMEQLRDKFGEKVICHETRFLKTGEEGYICLEGVNPLEAKLQCVEVENSSLKARLLDIDVLTKEGGISRRQLGLASRKCLLCDNDAKTCARSQKHRMEELLAEIEKILI